MGRKVDKTGQRYGRLIVLSRDVSTTGVKEYKWRCQCDCGEIISVIGSNLNSGRTSSCGCLRKEKTAITGRNTGPGNSKHPLYGTWLSMKNRCFNENSQGYSDYGGRGITIHGPWAESFEKFIADIGQRPSQDHSIDRIDNDGNYEPGNVRWATSEEQSNNRRNNRLLTDGEETLTLAQMSRKYGISPQALSYRLSKGEYLVAAIDGYKPHSY